jgi:hypothetical protein
MYKNKTKPHQLTHKKQFKKKKKKKKKKRKRKE